MRTTTIILTAAATLLATAANAAPVEKTFVHEGQSYTYTTTKDEAGRTIIQGHRGQNGEAFRLVVANGRVTGRSGNADVSFRVAEAKGAASGAAGTMAAFGR